MPDAGLAAEGGGQCPVRQQANRADVASKDEDGVAVTQQGDKTPQDPLHGERIAFMLQDDGHGYRDAA